MHGERAVLGSGERVEVVDGALQVRRLAADDADERNSAVSRQDAVAVAEEWLAGPDRPRAIFAAPDDQALGVLFTAHRLGLRVPEHLAVVGVDGTQHSAFPIPPLATVRQPLRELAQRAVDFLSGPPSVEPLRELLDFELVRRASCGCPEAAATR